MALLKNSRKLQKNAAKSVISKNKIQRSKAILKKPKGNKSTKGSITRKDKSPSKGGKRSSGKSTSNISSSCHQAYNKEQLKKIYEAQDNYLDSFPAPKALNRDKVKGYDLN